MKKLILTIALVALISSPALANLSLGGWEEGDSRTVHAVWTFDTQPGPDGTFYKYTASPEEYLVEGEPGAGTATAFILGINNSGTYANGGFTDPTRIDVMIELSNFTGGPSKMIWIDLDYEGTLDGMTAQGKVAGQSYDGILLLDPPAGSSADFGFLIRPNPDKEDIWFTIWAPVGVSPRPASLDSIHIDTRCIIPAPGAVLLGGIGVTLVGWLRRRRTL